MVSTTYEIMLKQAIGKGNISNASDWFGRNIDQLNGRTLTIISKSEDRLVSNLQTGKMYLFHYDPKFKKILPIYDRFPLLLPFEYAPGGFIGLNLHYLPAIARAKLLDQLMVFASDKSFDDKMRLHMSYSMIKGVSKAKLYEPCVKRYLNTHVKSRFLFIKPVEWGKAIFLPLADFVYKK